MTTMRTVKHPIAVFVVTVLTAIGVGVGVLAATVRPVRTYTVEGFLRGSGRTRPPLQTEPQPPQTSLLARVLPPSGKSPARLNVES